MYPTEHILYIILSLIVTGLILYLGHFIKSQKGKNLFLLFWSFACFFMHNIMIYVSYVRNGGGSGFAADNQIFPIYFCNYMMFLLVITALWNNKESKFFKAMATFVAYGGTFGALITLFVTPPGLGAIATAQAAFSHSFMLLGCLWLFVGGYVKINVYNTVIFVLGLLSCGVVGGAVELFHYAFKLPSPNAMYLVHGPVELPEFKWWMFFIALTAIVFVFTCIWEYFTRPKAERWYKTSRDLQLYFPSKKTKEKINKE